MPCSCEPINIAERGIRIGPAAPATDVVESLGNLVAWRWRSGVQSLAPRLPPCLVSARARRFGGSSSTCWGGLCGSSPSRRSRSALQRIAERWRCNRLAICEAEFVGHKVTSSRSPRRSNGTWRTSVVAAPSAWCHACRFVRHHFGDYSSVASAKLRASPEPTRSGQLINASYRVPRFGPVGAGADAAGGELCWGVFRAATSSDSRLISARFDETAS